MVPFAGHLLPVQYPTGVIAEHMAVRTTCGAFDVSHMGQLLFVGPAAENNLQRLLCNDLSGMQPGRARYSPVLNDRGGIVDDVVIFKHDDQRFTLIVNAINKDKDAAWFAARLRGEAKLIDLSDETAQIALQGPQSAAILARVSDAGSVPTRYYSFVEGLSVGGYSCLVSRTGYTGEWGYEVYCAPAHAREIMEALISAGEDLGLIPCGLGARDTLRLEASMPLYGHEMDENITPLEAGLGAFVKMDKGDFVGRDALLSRGEPRRTRIGLALTGRGIAREGCPVWEGDREIGRVTSGTFCPYLKRAMAMALVERDAATPRQPLFVEVRGNRIPAEIAAFPFYKRS